jgi:hypothetical protein
MSRVGGAGKEPSLIHPQGVVFWESGCGVLGKSQFGNPLKTKDNLAFSAPYIPFKYIFKYTGGVDNFKEACSMAVNQARVQ